MFQTVSRIGSHSYKKLFTPGPLSVKESVREKMVKELGSREPEFVELLDSVHQKILDLAELDSEEYCSVLMQGSGTYGVESGLQTIIPDDSRVLCLSNGAYGNRIIDMIDILGVDYEMIIGQEDEGLDLGVIAEGMSDYNPTLVTVVHCETSTDAMSSFGGVDFNMKKCHIDMMVTSINKCIQGVPGFSIVVCRKDLLENDYSRSISLNVAKQYQGFQNNGQFRFTPAIEVLLALDEAMMDLEKETIPGREARYVNNYKTLRSGIESLGYKAYLSEDLSGHVINSFLFPENNELFDFTDFYDYLLEDGLYIYPGKVTNADVFRIGTIGEIYKEDVEKLLFRIKSYSEKIGLL